MEVKWTLTVWLLLIRAAHLKNIEVRTEPEVIAGLGQSAILPCTVDSGHQASSLQVRWFKTVYNVPVHLFKDGVNKPEEQDRAYLDRTRVFPLEFSSGNVSLQISGITVRDNGVYTCYVQSSGDEQFADGEVSLKVAALGEHPLIQMEEYHSGGIRLRCRSTGWYPNPLVAWTDGKGRGLGNPPAGSEGNKTVAPGQNLVDVNSEITVSDPGDRFICRITHPLLKQTRVAVLQLTGDAFRTVSVLLVAFCLLLCLTLGLSVLLIHCCRTQYFTIKELRLRPSVKVYQKFKDDLRLQRELLVRERKLMKTAYHRIRMDAVTVTLDSGTMNPYLRLTEKPPGIRGESSPPDPVPSNGAARFDTLPAILGSEPMVSGRHYWEVEVGDAGHWILGVAGDAARRKGEPRLSDEEGFWLIRWREGACEALTSPPQPITSLERPHTVGVHLLFDEGRLSFYDAPSASHLYTFRVRFAAGVWPCLGLGPGPGPGPRALGELRLVSLTIVPRRVAEEVPETKGQPETSDPPATSDVMQNGPQAL